MSDIDTLIDQPITGEWLASLGGVHQFSEANYSYYQFIIKEDVVKNHRNSVDSPPESGLDILYLNIHPSHIEGDEAVVELYFNDFRDHEECCPLFGKLYLDRQDIVDLLRALGAPNV